MLLCLSGSQQHCSAWPSLILRLVNIHRRVNPLSLGAGGTGEGGGVGGPDGGGLVGRRYDEAKGEMDRNVAWLQSPHSHKEMEILSDVGDTLEHNQSVTQYWCLSQQRWSQRFCWASEFSMFIVTLSNSQWTVYIYERDGNQISRIRDPVFVKLLLDKVKWRSVIMKLIKVLL